MDKTLRIYTVLFISCIFFCSCGGRSNQKQANQSQQTAGKASMLNPNITESDGIFSVPEYQIMPSPDKEQHFTLPGTEKITAFDVSPVMPQVAMITSQADGTSAIKVWQIGDDEPIVIYQLPNNGIAKDIAWHPAGNILFIIVETPEGYQIARIEQNDNEWVYNSIFESPKPLKRLLVGPRPFDIPQITELSYRLYIGMETNDGAYRIVTITEHGQRLYQVVGPESTKTTIEELDADFEPSTMYARWSLPVAFHPAGHQLIWEDKNNRYFVADYWREAWDKAYPMKLSKELSGTINPTSNGLGLFHWNPHKDGIGLYWLPSGDETGKLANYSFVSAPRPVADGKGIVGITSAEGRYTLNYLPVDMPLHDVINAWQFISSPDEANLLQKHYGLFRPTHSNLLYKQNDQLYKLYETENYYHRSDLSRPYIVTTDLMWEIFGAAYQGIFIIREKEEAIPAFWKFIDEADAFIVKSGKLTAWKPVFDAVIALRSNNKTNPETERILAEEDAFTEIINDNYRYSDLKPRGHYTSSPEMENYFRAFRYFTTIYLGTQDTLKELNQLPEEIRRHAERWIVSYSGFIAPSRAPMIWKGMSQTTPAYCQFPAKNAGIFPLSWGFDNEVLYSTVFHEDFPSELQIISRNMERRIFSSGIDLSAAMGNSFAENMMKSDYEKYPNLQKVINRLKKNFSESREKGENIYDRWLDAMAVQWADTVHSRNGAKDRNIWQAKRLQTGLATWATLRHATILVNDRGAAESGEGGFETFIAREPRGSVEPDPYTFEAIAGLFDAMVHHVETMIDETVLADAQSSLYEGIIKKLNDAAAEVRIFREIAKKESHGEILTGQEYRKIMQVANMAEHLFLIFSSLGNEEYALSEPDPMPKIADVALDRDSNDCLMVAVGNAMEWNHIVPFYGRRQIVRGAIYSYYEFISDVFLNDEEWRERVDKQELMPWVKPYVIKKGIPESRGY